MEAKEAHVSAAQNMIDEEDQDFQFEEPSARSESILKIVIIEMVCNYAVLPLRTR